MINEFAEVTRNQALRALTASSEELAGVQVVRGTIAGQRFPWLLDTALAMVRSGRGIAAIFWDADAPDCPGLALVDDAGTVVYRFTTVNPFEMTEPGPPHTTRRAALRIARPAS